MMVVDTGAMLALLDASDEHHLVIKELYEENVAGWTLPSVILPPNTSGDPDAMFSEHAGGCQVLFGDGSVRFISDMINQLVWSAMASRAGNEMESQEQ